MKIILLFLQVFLSIALVGLVLVQSRGKGLGRSFGQSSSFTRRGLEKVIFKATFLFAALFLLTSILNITL